MSVEKNYFEKLVDINVKKQVEKKGNLDYLSWANAWAFVKQVHPLTQRTVYEAPETGLNWFTDGVTGYVKVGITIDGLEHIDYLPIKDFRQKSITVDKITSMDVNTAIQRATAKAIAMHGLGLSLYAGEDLLLTNNEVVAPIKAKEKPKAKEATTFELNIKDENWDKVLKFIAKNKALGMSKIIKTLETKYKIKATVKTELIKSLENE